ARNGRLRFDVWVIGGRLDALKNRIDVSLLEHQGIAGQRYVSTGQEAHLGIDVRLAPRRVVHHSAGQSYEKSYQSYAKRNPDYTDGGPQWSLADIRRD